MYHTGLGTALRPPVDRGATRSVSVDGMTFIPCIYCKTYKITVALGKIYLALQFKINDRDVNMPAMGGMSGLTRNVHRDGRYLGAVIKDVAHVHHHDKDRECVMSDQNECLVHYDLR